MKKWFSYIPPKKVRDAIQGGKLSLSKLSIEEVKEDIRYFLSTYFQCTEKEITASIESIAEEKQ